RVLRAHLALRPDPLRPVNDERIADTTAIGLSLPAAEWCVPSKGPAPGVVVEVLRPAYILKTRQVPFERIRHVVEELVLVDRSGWSALGAGAVVRNEHNKRVVPLTDTLQEVEQTAVVVVGVRQEAGEDLHHPGI